MGQRRNFRKFLPNLTLSLAFLNAIFSYNGVSGHCQSTCIPNGYACKDLYSGKLDFEQKIGEPCKPQTGGKVGLTSSCCSTQADLDNKLNFERGQALINSLTGAEKNEYPYQIKLKSDLGDCGGSVYNKDWILTAAHCLCPTTGKGPSTPVAGTKVIAGLSNVDDAPEENTYEASEIICNSGYTGKGVNNIVDDTALIKLKRPLKLEIGKIQPMRLASPNFLPNYRENAVFTGFGTTNLGKGSPDLLEISIPLHEPTKCARLSTLEGGNMFLPADQHICVGGDDSGYTVGTGDSGGPLICADEHNKPVHCGIASFKFCVEDKENPKGCKNPSYFARTSSFISWINKKTKNAKQEEEFIFDLPLFPTKVLNAEAPDYLVRIIGKTRMCTGVLISPKMIVTANDCTTQSGGYGIYHIKSGSGLLSNGNAQAGTIGAYKSDISKNITLYLERPLNQNDVGIILLPEPVNYKFAELPPKNYKIKDSAVEVTMNENIESLESRRYKPLDRKECLRRTGTIDKNLKLDESHLCMTQVFSGEPECNRDLGAPLMCDGKYVCGISSFRGCKFSAFPEIFTNLISGNPREIVKAYAAVP